MMVELSEQELAYISRAIFRQRTDVPEDQPQLAAQLDPKISVARVRANRQATLLIGYVDTPKELGS